jgi:hypothetical protein
VASNRKTNKPNTQSENGTKNASEQNLVKQVFLGEYFNIHTFQKHPITESFYAREAKALKEWSELETSLKIADFYDWRGYDPKQFYRWVANHEEMSLAHDYALRRVGSRREIGAITRKYAETTIHKVHGHYDQIWREEMRLMNEARLAIADKAESRVVIIERFPSPSGEYHDVDVVSTSKLDPQEVASNIRRNTATDRQVKVNANVGESHE